ncbi:glycoside hydrolase family 3 N-terminal domain-containing protein [Reichenbachiella agariperforans]|uniref:glycoside hydrolase family 3 N-terminal domain-containing protein n=1 Tax=Reichenbachiella agariperforans TaxID=156994 RepID=UPI001C09A83B|nr:glycoside hydrolase family 3 N-terminal domain-containing protein [Reichenbachiella agariperforans]MBU2913406.1 glycoside hydrolase family 3 C-terminal domain-containing protein [Reichenbachiella agariperforans]
MKKIIISVLAATTVIIGFSFFTTKESQKEITKIERVEKLLAQMTLEEKVGQMAQVTLDVITEGDTEFSSYEPLKLSDELVNKAILEYHVGSVLNTANNRARSTEKWHEVVSQLQEVATTQTRLKIPVIYGIDAIHGTTYTAGATLFPQEIAQAATFNRELVRRGAEICAYETRASAIPWTFSPVLDMGRDPRFPRIWEGFGEDVYLTSEMGVQMIKGYEGEDNDISNPLHVASCLKHFLGYSVPLSGKDRTPAFIPEIELRERHIPAFKAALDAGAHTVMINSGLINGTPVHANYDILTKLLKEELGFDGVAVTDWADIDNLYTRDKVAATPKEAVKIAINAGIDMAMIPYSFDFCEDLVELVNEGEVPMSRIDDAVRRILNLKHQLGLFDTPVTHYKDYDKFGSKEFETAAYNAAAEAITLLKNQEATLPLKKGAKLLVTGPNANSMRSLNGGWSYSWQGEKVEEFAAQYNTILEAIQNFNGKKNVTHVAGVSYVETGKYWEETTDIPAAVQAAEKVDYIVLCLGENSYTEKPGDLHDLKISQNQIDLALALVKTGKPVILVLNEGRPRLIKDFAEGMDAIVQTYLPGNFGGDALADILFGKVNPSGKLPYTYPMYANTLVTYDHKPSEEQDKMEGMYDYESDFAVQFPFGYGLSYTTFEYSDLTVSSTSPSATDELTISVKVTNTGKVAGKEVVQLYISDLVASISPDMKRLRGFEKINLKAGESKTVRFTITGSDIAFVTSDLQWTVEKGDFAINIGGQSDKFEITETKKFGQSGQML